MIKKIVLIIVAVIIAIWVIGAILLFAAPNTMDSFKKWLVTDNTIAIETMMM